MAGKRYASTCHAAGEASPATCSAVSPRHSQQRPWLRVPWQVPAHRAHRDALDALSIITCLGSIPAACSQGGGASHTDKPANHPLPLLIHGDEMGVPLSLGQQGFGCCWPRLCRQPEPAVGTAPCPPRCRVSWGRGWRPRWCPARCAACRMRALGESCGCFLTLLSPLRAVSELFCTALMGLYLEAGSCSSPSPGRLQAEGYKDWEISPGSKGSCAQQIPPGCGGGWGHEAALRPPQTFPAALAGSQQSRTQPAGYH